MIALRMWVFVCVCGCVFAVFTLCVDDAVNAKHMIWRWQNRNLARSSRDGIYSTAIGRVKEMKLLFAVQWCSIQDSDLEKNVFCLYAGNVSTTEDKKLFRITI